MGWTTTHRPKGQNLTEFFIERGVLSWGENNEHTYKVLDSATVKMKTYYVAVEQVHKVTGVRRVWAGVFLLGYYPKDHHNFGWKDMDESMGPCEDDCPERILKLLTDTEYEHAKDWRARCWAKIEKRKTMPKAEVGSVVTLFGKDYQIIEKLGRKGFRANGLTQPGNFRISLSHVPKFTAVKPAASL